MCDFSLEMYRTRLAREGETYKTARFPSGTIGLAPMGGDSTPVCVPYDTCLILEDIPQELQASLPARVREDSAAAGAWGPGDSDGAAGEYGARVPRGGADLSRATAGANLE
jgi:hypothetical protein